MKKLLCASTALLAFVLAALPCTPAHSTDLGIASIYKAAPAPVTNWTGSYVGFSGSGAWGSAVVRNDLTGADQRFDLGGGTVGVASGYNLQNGNVVLGYEGDTSVSNRKGSAFEFPPNAAFSNDVKERWLSTLRGRLGYAQDNWLVYATAGGALGAVDNSLAGPLGQISDKQWHLGWTAGAGVELRLTQDWTAKIEYLYVGLQDKSYFTPAPNAAFSSNQRVALDDHIIRFGVNYKLPWGILDGFFKK